VGVGPKVAFGGKVAVATAGVRVNVIDGVGEGPLARLPGASINAPMPKQ
jgi:hypothetical protein